jgi:hypothetical protein
MGTAQLNATMTKLNQLIVSAVVYAAIIGVGSQLMVKKLEQDTAKQCAQHAWPVDADQLHKDWCKDNGYKI